MRRPTGGLRGQHVVPTYSAPRVPSSRPGADRMPEPSCSRLLSCTSGAPELLRTLRGGPRSVFLRSGMQSYFLQVVLLHHAIGKIVDHLARPEKEQRNNLLQVHSSLRASSSSTIPHLLRCCCISSSPAWAIASAGSRSR